MQVYTVCTPYQLANSKHELPQMNSILLQRESHVLHCPAVYTSRCVHLWIRNRNGDSLRNSYLGTVLSLIVNQKVICTSSRCKSSCFLSLQRGSIIILVGI